jgi:hypothetical protein
VPSNPTGTPFGALDALSLTPGGVIVRGWAIDPDASDARVEVHVYVDGTLKAGTIAKDTRTDVEQAFQRGAEHGYSVEIPLGVGDHEVCTYGINAAASAGMNSLLACRTTTRTGDPLGNITSHQSGTTTQTSISWLLEAYLIDPDTSAPIEVHIYRFPWIDSAAVPRSADYGKPQFIGAIRADAEPPANIPTVFISGLIDRYGSRHGVTADLLYDNIAGVTCAYAVNVPGTPGKNYLLGCAGQPLLRPVDGRP